MQKSPQNTSEKRPTPFMNVLVDYAFKRVFGSTQNKHILTAMLNAFLSDYIGKIENIELLHPEQLGILPTDKKVSYDIYSKESDKRRILIEMQYGKHSFYNRRAVAYISRAVSNELRRGDRKYNFPDVISLNFLNYHDAKIMGKGGLMQRVMLKNDDNEIFSEKIMFFSFI